jgi:hypothetical protein
MYARNVASRQLRNLCANLLFPFFLVAALLVATRAEGGSLPLRAGGGYFSVEVTSFQERRFATIVKQQEDYSCGSAALATLLRHHYQKPVDEATIFAAMYEAGDQEKIRTLGFSLLDLKSYLEQRGYRADGYRLPLERLAEAGVPAIALINDDGYRHFVVIKGLARQKVLVGDPARGLKTMSQVEFERIWNGILFVVHSRLEVGQSHFNLAPEWGRAPPAPVDMALLQRSVAPLGLLQHPFHDL